MANSTILDIAQAEQDQMLSQLRQARYGYLLALHVLLLCAAGRTPTEIAAFLFCSRSSVYRIVAAYHSQSLGFEFTSDGTLLPLECPNLRWPDLETGQTFMNHVRKGF